MSRRLLGRCSISSIITVRRDSSNDIPHACCADAVIGISIAILILLFIFQRVGTSKIGFTFSPIVVYWYVLNGGCGIFNIVRYYPGVFKVRRPTACPYFTDDPPRFCKVDPAHEQIAPCRTTQLLTACNGMIRPFGSCHACGLNDFVAPRTAGAGTQLWFRLLPPQPQAGLGQPRRRRAGHHWHGGILRRPGARRSPQTLLWQTKCLLATLHQLSLLCAHINGSVATHLAPQLIGLCMSGSAAASLMYLKRPHLLAAYREDEIAVPLVRHAHRDTST